MRFALTLALLAAALPVFAADPSPLVIPKPVALTRDSGSFTLTPQTVIVADTASQPAARILADQLFKSTGYRLPIQSQANGAAIILRVEGSAAAGAESYKLAVASSGATITAPAYAGIANGVQTLLQLLPSAIYSDHEVKGRTWVIPAVRIEDQPSYAWRGMMLDSSRYFFDKAFVLRYLDIMAAHKLNVLHFHLIDDAGWRLEIKKYPKLTEIGAFRGEGPTRQGGFYTQEDIREIVKYAADRNITVVPELELPAHTLSAIAAYPWLSCTGKEQKVPAVHFISDDLYCAGKATTWQFLHDVLDEMCVLFPSTYIHIGGDEAKYTKWKACPDCQKKMKELGLKSEHELQGWMTTEVENYLKKKGRQILGWDEILGCGVSTTAGLMPWHDPKAVTEGAKRGNPLVLALTNRCYFDVPESKEPGEVPGATWLPPISLQQAYEWHPTPDGLTPQQEKTVLGAEGCLWSDQFLHKPFLADTTPFNEDRSARYLEYLMLPRAAALAEVTWTPKASRDWKDFSTRMARQYARYAAAGWNHRLPIPQVTFTKGTDGKLTATAVSEVEDGGIRYTTDGNWPLAYSPAYTKPVTVEKESDFRAVAVNADGHISLPFQTKAADNRFAKYGEQIGEWKSGKVGDRKPLTVEFDATGKINQAGTYEVTFQFTDGKQRLDIDSVEVFLNQDSVAKDVHHGTTGATNDKNVYRLKVDRYETGASFKIRAAVYGDEGSDSNGVVLLKKVP
ncbi:family 20 glycosylhydrolase [Luteolibacter ambystomatis]|uniref:beta-N-acetylhexosaminidase n=1 Tax=Luteolibacter ambystomatis TaxID=2824561 RepID=A0A975G9E0_9BACT|nr:family 20 glycosylhydrolase [Luteolibacter ambystomatis]QUE51191.1 family 20 glycosylhydrolase [Luteolibacter ambystomatis]